MMASKASANVVDGLTAAGLAPNDVTGPEFDSHLEVALAIAVGAADELVECIDFAGQHELDNLSVRNRCAIGFRRTHRTRTLLRRSGGVYSKQKDRARPHSTLTACRERVTSPPG